MRSLHASWLLPAALIMAAASAAAQGGAAPPSRPNADPLDAAAAVPPVIYRSTLSTFGRRAADEPVPWREANERVARIGGWRAYTREASTPDAPGDRTPATQPGAEAAQTPMSRPAPGSRDGQGKH